MDHISFSDPHPRTQPIDYQPYCVSAAAARYLEIPQSTSYPVFWDVLQRRKSRRTFGSLDASTLGSLLWYSAKTTVHTRHVDSGLSWEHRSAPSAGGLHPIHLVVQLSGLLDRPLACYDPYGHALREIDVSPETCDGLRHHADSVLDTQSGTVLWLVGDFNKTSAAYTNASSLVWRDVGALIGTVCLVAEALELNACPLGICGDEAIRKVIPMPDGVHGVGVVVIGSREN